MDVSSLVASSDSNYLMCKTFFTYKKKKINKKKIKKMCYELAGVVMGLVKQNLAEFLNLSQYDSVLFI